MSNIDIYSYLVYSFVIPPTGDDMVNELSVSRLSYLERLRLHHESMKVETVLDAMIILGSCPKKHCDHNWEYLTVRGYRYFCNHGNRWHSVSDDHYQRCTLCGVSKYNLISDRKQYPHLFPHQDRHDRWHLPILWPLFLKRWLLSKTQHFQKLISKKATSVQVS